MGIQWDIGRRYKEPLAHIWLSPQWDIQFLVRSFEKQHLNKLIEKINLRKIRKNPTVKFQVSNRAKNKTPFGRPIITVWQTATWNHELLITATQQLILLMQLTKVETVASSLISHSVNVCKHAPTLSQCHSKVCCPPRFTNNLAWLRISDEKGYFLTKSSRFTLMLLFLSKKKIHYEIKAVTYHKGVWQVLIGTIKTRVSKSPPSIR